MRSGYVAEASVPADTSSGYVRAMTGSALEAAVTARFIAVNGDHPMTPADDTYVSAWFLPLPRLAERAGVAVDELRRLILDGPQPGSGAWRAALHRLVDELDELEPPFAPYDRLRFGGPVSRDRFIDEPRTRFPGPSP